ncbi:TetR/AcrR family transcriptional regulator [Mycolicibacterium aubagnense]|uniref:TetR family transcriptional regulator n=2 Tax=Mycolicibacterium aubagnense TaxID=319707 RepID=A0ABM7IFA6_9MYCO|nr:TetR/AcrR family transcriptional regulator [Mycolicibacterium aubagnense]BBX85363.1 TetR family transcriptional regulator [Mycolicibacterium aubagnense]
MDTASSRVAGRLTGARAQKFAARRQALAVQATGGLAELGFARASMRELAQHCEISLGILHYYFDDKDDLVVCCVRQYKDQFIDRYNSIVIEGGSGPELKTRISGALSNSLRESAVMHRLWYDLRTQALFDDRFALSIDEIDDSLAALTWKAVTAYARLTGKSVIVAPAIVYATADGLFHRALRDLITGDTEAPERLAREIDSALDDFVGLTS